MNSTENKFKKLPESNNQAKNTAEAKTLDIKIKSQGKTEQLTIDNLKDSSSIMTDKLFKANSVTKSEKILKNTDNSFQSYGTGRRKNAIARVWIRTGSGKLTVNKKVGEQYFTREFHKKLIFAPLIATKKNEFYDIICTVQGGGYSGQAGAIQHGLARALDKLLPELHLTLRQGGYLTRDSRVVERKKYGQPKARKNFQFSKR